MDARTSSKSLHQLLVLWSGRSQKDMKAGKKVKEKFVDKRVNLENAIADGGQASSKHITMRLPTGTSWA